MIAPMGSALRSTLSALASFALAMLLAPAPAASAGLPVAEPLFAAGCLPRLRTLRRMRHDLELDAHGASVALALLERIDELERQLRRLRAQLPRSSP